MAIGADRGILVQSDAELQPLAVAKLLKALVEKEAPQLVVLGKQAIDDDSNQTGQMLAALLGWPQACLRLEGRGGCGLGEGDARDRRRAPRRSSCRCRRWSPPICGSTSRATPLPNIMKAKKKPLETVEPGDLGWTVSPRLTTLKGGRTGPGASAGVLVADVAQLVDKLKNEAKVI